MSSHIFREQPVGHVCCCSGNVKFEDAAFCSIQQPGRPKMTQDCNKTFSWWKTWSSDRQPWNILATIIAFMILELFHGEDITWCWPKCSWCRHLPLLPKSVPGTWSRDSMQHLWLTLFFENFHETKYCHQRATGQGAQQCHGDWQWIRGQWSEQWQR